jgi:fibronectin type 3 domain-containing protein
MASAYAGRTAKIMVDGRDAAVLTAPVDGWLAFSDVKSAPVAIAAGQHTIRIHFQTGNTNTRYLDIAKLTGLPPQIVTGLAGTANDGSVDLVWDASIGATSYKVVRGIDTVATVSGTAYHDAAVVNGTTYSYVIVASNSFGNASASAAVSVTPTAPPPPAGPEGLVANASDAQVQLSWTPTVGATVYKIWRSLDGVAFQNVGQVSNAQYLDAGLQNGTVYSYFVTSKNDGIKGALESLPSDTVQATPRGNAPPKVAGLVATPGESDIRLDWIAQPQASAYAVFRGVEDGPRTLVTVTSIPQYIDFAVAVGTRYSYAIVASNEWGEGPASDVVVGTIPFPPEIPVNLVAVAGNATVSLTWLGVPRGCRRRQREDCHRLDQRDLHRRDGGQRHRVCLSRDGCERGHGKLPFPPGAGPPRLPGSRGPGEPRGGGWQRHRLVDLDGWPERSVLQRVPRGARR